VGEINYKKSGGQVQLGAKLWAKTERGQRKSFATLQLENKLGWITGKGRANRSKSF